MIQSHRSIPVAALMMCLASVACGDDDAGTVSTSGGSAGSGSTKGGGATAIPPIRMGGGGAGGSAGSGASGSGGGLAAPTGVDGEKLVAELSTAEVQALCDGLDEQLANIVTDQQLQELGCTLLALLTTGKPDSSGQLQIDEAACKQSVDACVRSGLDMPSTSMSQCMPEQLPMAAIGCDTTVNEYLACIGSGTAELTEQLELFTCETLADPAVAATALSGAMGDPAAVPECAGIEASCPALLESPSASGPPAADGCDDTCSDANDGFCDDGGDGGGFAFCALGTDCADCGPR